MKTDYPPCVHCGRPNWYGQRYRGFCLECHNCGVPELLDARDQCSRVQSEKIFKLQALVPELLDRLATAEDFIRTIAANADKWGGEWLREAVATHLGISVAELRQQVETKPWPSSATVSLTPRPPNSLA